MISDGSINDLTDLLMFTHTWTTLVLLFLDSRAAFIDQLLITRHQMVCFCLTDEGH